MSDRNIWKGTTRQTFDKKQWKYCSHLSALPDGIFENKCFLSYLLPTQMSPETDALHLFTIHWFPFAKNKWIAWRLWNVKRQSQNISRLILLTWNAWLPTFQPSPHLSTQGFETPPIPPSFFQGEILTALIFDSQGQEIIFDEKSHAFMFYDFHMLETPKQCLLHEVGIDYYLMMAEVLADSDYLSLSRYLSFLVFT